MSDDQQVYVVEVKYKIAVFAHDEERACAVVEEFVSSEAPSSVVARPLTRAMILQDGDFAEAKDKTPWFADGCPDLIFGKTVWDIVNLTTPADPPRRPVDDILDKSVADMKEIATPRFLCCGCLSLVEIPYVSLEIDDGIHRGLSYAHVSCWERLGSPKKLDWDARERTKKLIDEALEKKNA